MPLNVLFQPILDETYKEETACRFSKAKGDSLLDPQRVVVVLPLQVQSSSASCRESMFMTGLQHSAACSAIDKGCKGHHYNLQEAAPRRFRKADEYDPRDQHAQAARQYVRLSQQNFEAGKRHKLAQQDMPSLDFGSDHQSQIIFSQVSLTQLSDSAQDTMPLREGPRQAI